MKGMSDTFCGGWCLAKRHFFIGGLIFLVCTAVLASGEMTSTAANPQDAKGPYLTLTDAWQLAEANHPLVTEAKQRLISLEREVQARQAEYAPTLTISGGGLSVNVHEDGKVTWFTPAATVNASQKFPSGLTLSGSVTARSGRGASGSNLSPSLSGNVNATYPLSQTAAFDSDALGLHQAKIAWQAAWRRSQQLQDEVRADVLDALHSEQAAAVRLQLAQEQFAEAKKRRQLALHQLETGILTEVERISAELDWLRAEQDLIVAKRTWESRREQLLDLLGLADEKDKFQFESVLDWSNLPEFGSLDDALKKALDYSVTIWEQRQAEETARLQYEDERSRSPLNASMQGSYRSPGTSSSQANPTVWSIGLELSYPLADGGQRVRALESRREAYDRAQQARLTAERELEEQLRQLLIEGQDALRAVDIARLELRRAELELAAAKRQAELPVASVTDVTVEQRKRDVERARLGLSEAIHRYRSHWIAWQRLQGDVPWEGLIGRSLGGDH